MSFIANSSQEALLPRKPSTANSSRETLIPRKPSTANSSQETLIPRKQLDEEARLFVLSRVLKTYLRLLADIPNFFSSGKPWIGHTKAEADLRALFDDAKRYGRALNAVLGGAEMIVDDAVRIIKADDKKEKHEHKHGLFAYSLERKSHEREYIRGALDGVAQDILRFQRPTEFSAFIPLPFGTSIEDTTSANIQWIADMRAKMTQMSRRVFYAQGKPTELESDTGLLLKLILWLYKAFKDSSSIQYIPKKLRHESIYSLIWQQILTTERSLSRDSALERNWRPIPGGFPTSRNDALDVPNTSSAEEENTLRDWTSFHDVVNKAAAFMRSAHENSSVHELPLQQNQERTKGKGKEEQEQEQGKEQKGLFKRGLETVTQRFKSRSLAKDRQEVEVRGDHARTAFMTTRMAKRYGY